MKILILTDGMNWICDRIAKATQQHIEGITVGSYIKEPDLLGRMQDFDILHYYNSDVAHQYASLKRMTKPWLLSIRSFRYPAGALMVKPTKTHIVHPGLCKEFPGAVFVADPIMMLPQPQKQVVVGFVAGAGGNLEYKGFHLVQSACVMAGCAFKPALGNIPPHKMLDYYNSVDVVVIASEAEGHGTIALECAMLNKPFIMAPASGLAGQMGLGIACERSAESIAATLCRCFKTSEQVKHLTLERHCQRMEQVYESLL